jgi:hypothetical protein
MSNGAPKCLAMAEEAYDQIVPGRRFGQADRTAPEPLAPGPPLDRFALDRLGVRSPTLGFAGAICPS